jgi:hypothetical protein
MQIIEILCICYHEIALKEVPRIKKRAARSPGAIEGQYLKAFDG